MKKIVFALFLMVGAATLHAGSPFVQDTSHKKMHKKGGDTSWHKKGGKMKKDSSKA